MFDNITDYLIKVVDALRTDHLITAVAILLVILFTAGFMYNLRDGNYLASAVYLFCSIAIGEVFRRLKGSV